MTPPLELVSDRTEKEIDDYIIDNKPCRLDCTGCRRTFYTIAQWRKFQEGCTVCREE